MKRLVSIYWLALALIFASGTHAGIADRAVRDTSSGVDLIAYPTAADDLVSIQGALYVAPTAGQEALHHLTAQMLTRGTARGSKIAIERQLEELGANRGFSGMGETLEFYGICLKEDVGELIELLAEELRSPAFPQEEFAKAKAELQGQMAPMLDEPEALAREKFFASAFPSGHPNHRPLMREVMAALGPVTLEDVKRFHEESYRSGQLLFVVAGAINSSQVKRQVHRAFKGWQGKPRAFPEVSPAQATRAQDVLVRLQDKPSVSIYWGQPSGLRHRDPDALPLRMGTAILGHGFSARLMVEVRDKEGLTYGIHARHYGDVFHDGGWVVLASFAPSLLEKGLASTRREVTKWWQEGVTAQELAEQKTGMIGRFQLDLATTDGIATALKMAVQRGYKLQWLDEYPKQIEALTLEQVNGAIQKYLDPNHFTLIKAGTLP